MNQVSSNAVWEATIGKKVVVGRRLKRGREAGRQTHGRHDSAIRMAA